MAVVASSPRLSSTSLETPRLAHFLAVGLIAGAVIALQIAVMRIIAVGSWAHFGSLVVSLAMLGFSLSSVVIFVGKDWFGQHWRGAACTALLLLGPFAVASNLVAQTLPFNAIFLVSDPAQKWRLMANFLLYLLPFLAGAFFLGIVFLKSRTAFSRVYFADLTGSGLAGLVVLISLYFFAPEHIIAVPLVLWAVGAVLWFSAFQAWKSVVAVAVVAALSLAGYVLLPGILGVPNIAVSQYKGVAYARNFPDGKRIYRSISPFGDLQVYASSYMHFAPGLSDNAAFGLPEIPANTYVGMYRDGDYDLAGFAVGAAERSRLLPRGDVAEGDVILGLASSGVHSNGFSLVRRIVELSGLGWASEAPFQPDATLGEALLTPTRIYVKPLLAAIRACDGIKALAHITGGGFPDNIPRVLPDTLSAEIDLDAITVPPVFSWLAKTGGVEAKEMLRTFNCGIGMIAVVTPDKAAEAEAVLAAEGEQVVRLGRMVARQHEGVTYKGRLAL